MRKNISKLLIANRGEIALRIMRTAKEMGIKTVAVYSKADMAATHVSYADEAVCVGEAPSSASYLNKENIIAAAKQTKADAIHPGYGFLSENPAFATMVEKSGITFVGPSAKAMETMGNKLKAKQAVKKYGIPLVPGTETAIKNIKEGEKIAKKIGFPVLVKASAGGGGKGMRVIRQQNELKSGLQRAISEAEKAFGDGAVFIEKYLESSKHIEIQILADTKGNIVHLNERECSIQRRHQKVVEEAPSVSITQEIRTKMGNDAINVAKACNYVGAGTVEFIYAEGKYYFLEMNTRLQVEHPVTEMITGIDLVAEQLKIAMGQLLSISQSEVGINGHAIEVRVYAEDAENNFLPSTGTLKTYLPPMGNGVRVDDGVCKGDTISVYYDPMLSKLIVHASNRPLAIKKMVRAIEDYNISGVETTLGFCKFAIQHKAFADGTFDTHFVEKYYSSKKLEKTLTSDESKVLAIIITNYLNNQKGNLENPQSNNSHSSNWWKQRNFLS